MNFRMSNRMETEELKTFLQLRGLKVTVKKRNLCRRAFCAIENNVILMKKPQEVKAQIKEE